MSTSNEVAAMRLALELLKSAHVSTDLVWKRHDCVQTLEEALAKQEQGEPVAWRDRKSGTLMHEKWLDADPLYTAPQQRTWVGLTDEEYLEAESVVWVTINLDSDEKVANREFYKAIEAKLREKNSL